jgi:NADP-dependent 3-hydroxy acid dehydrogenase YdfG
MKNHVLVTGASGNLGKIIVEELHQNGHAIFATISSERDLKVFEDLENVETRILDVLNADKVEKFINENEIFHIEAAVLLVGGFVAGDIHQTDIAMLEKMYQLNFISAFNIVKPLMSQFEKQGSGQFIFVGAKPTLNPEEGKNLFAYSLSKSLIFKMAELINSAGKNHHITATVLVPSTIDTPQNRNSMPDAEFEKWITPKDIGKTINFILTETGKTLRESVLKLYNKV